MLTYPLPPPVDAISSGWVLAELFRLLTHSSTQELWREEESNFYSHVQEWPELRDLLVLSFKELAESTFGDILQTRAF